MNPVSSFLGPWGFFPGKLAFTLETMPLLKHARSHRGEGMGKKQLYPVLSGERTGGAK